MILPGTEALRPTVSEQITLDIHCPKDVMFLGFCAQKTSNHRVCLILRPDVGGTLDVEGYGMEPILHPLDLPLAPYASEPPASTDGITRRCCDAGLISASRQCCNTVDGKNPA